MIKTGVIVIGTEITNGFASDTNSEYIARILVATGFDCRSIIKVPDAIDVITGAIDYLLTQCQVLILTGGLGSTHDDLTREAISKATGRELILNADLEVEIERAAPPGADREMFFKQAYLPVGARAIVPEHGTAPGIIIENKDQIIIALPGVPREMKAMLNAVILALNNKFPDQAAVKQEIIKIFGVSEPTVAKLIDPIIKEYQDIGFTILAGAEEIKIVVSVFADPESAEASRMEEAVKKIIGKLGDLVFGRDDVKLEETVGNDLRKKQISLAVAESCTGGLLAKKITSIPGSSEYFKGGIVSYSNQIKTQVLNVSHETLRKFGAVSREAAVQMAWQVRQLAQSDIAVSITGIAGPSGGTREKPVGLTYIALADNKRSYCKQYNFTGNRHLIQKKAAQTGLNLIRLYLQKKLYDDN